MLDWDNVLEEIERLQRRDALDVVRRDYLNRFHRLTGRNVLAYYSGWLQQPELMEGPGITDSDMNGLVRTASGLKPEKGLDLILHTPGGSIGATEAIGDFLHLLFGNDIRAIIPQLAMSAGTMIACACKEIVMGGQSSLGPIDPQLRGVAASGVLEEFDRAAKDISEDQPLALLWQIIISNYHPTFIGECEKAIEWAKEIASKWLMKNMFAKHKNKKQVAERIVAELCDWEKLKNHDRHLQIEACKKLGLKVVSFQTLGTDFEDLIFTIHNIYMYTFAESVKANFVVKIIENHRGKSAVDYIQATQNI